MGEVPDRTAYTLGLYRTGLRNTSLRGKTTIDLGCGELRPLELSALFYLNGANLCIAVDQAPTTDEHASAVSLAAILDRCKASTQDWLWGDQTVFGFRQRMRKFDLEALRAGDLGRGVSATPLIHAVGDVCNLLTGADVVVSSTVLEHISRADLTRILAHFRRVLKPGGVMYHNVDYTDHGVHADPTLNYWSFMTEGHAVADIEDGGNINKLRNSQVNAMFEEAGFEIEVDPLLRITPPDHVLETLTEEWRELSIDDMELVSTGILAKASRA